MAIFAKAVSEPSAALLQRWEEEVVADFADCGDGEQEVARAKLKELVGIREDLAKAQLTLQAKGEQKNAAVQELQAVVEEQNELSQAQAIAGELSDEAEGDDATDAGRSPRGGLTPQVEEKKKKSRGWGSKLMHKMHLDKHKKRSKSPFGGEAEVGSVCTTPSTPISSPQRQQQQRMQRRFQEANDVLMQAAEDLEDAAEEVDRLGKRCEALALDVPSCFAAEEAAYTRGIQDTVKEATLALEEWAIDARQAIVSSRRPSVAEARAGADFETSSVDSPPPSGMRSSGAEGACLSSLSTAPSEEELEEEERDFEHRASRLARRNEELLKALPQRRRALGSGLRRPPGRPVEAAMWDSDEGAGGSSPSTGDPLARLAKENRALEADLRLRRPRHLSIRRSCAALEAEVETLETIAAVCARFGPEFMALGRQAAAEAALAKERSADVYLKEAVEPPTTPKAALAGTSVGSPCSDSRSTASAPASSVASGVVAVAAPQRQSPLRPPSLDSGHQAPDSDELMAISSSGKPVSSPTPAFGSLPSFSRDRPRGLSPAMAPVEEGVAHGSDADAWSGNPFATEIVANPFDGDDDSADSIPCFGERKAINPSPGQSSEDRSEDLSITNGVVRGGIVSFGAACRQPANPFEDAASESGASSLQEPPGGNPFGASEVSGANPFGAREGAASPLRGEAAGRPVEEVGASGNPFEDDDGGSQADAGGRNPFEGSEGDSVGSGAEEVHHSVTDLHNSVHRTSTVVGSAGRSSCCTDSTFSLGKAPSPRRQHASDVPQLDGFARPAHDVFGMSPPASERSGLGHSGRETDSDGSASEVQGPVRTPRQTLAPGFGSQLQSSMMAAHRSASAAEGSTDGSVERTPRTLQEDQMYGALGVGAPRGGLAPRMQVSDADEDYGSVKAATATGFAGCFAGSGPAEPATRRMPRPSTMADAQVQRAFDVPSMEVGLARSDKALHRGRLTEDGGGYWDGEWQDYAVEEQHRELLKCSQSVSETLSEEDWPLFAYEVLLLANDWLGDGPEAESVGTTVSLCRVSLRINMLLHHRLAELTLPDGSQRYSPFDVRYRAAVLLRSWIMSEATGFGGEGPRGSHIEWTHDWIRRQIAVLRGSVLARSVELHRANEANRQSSRIVCAFCLQALGTLEDLLARGAWGNLPDEVDSAGNTMVDGRRLIVDLMQTLDSLRPVSGDWCFNTVFVAKVFSQLWRAAADEDSETKLSLDAPTVAAALLSGLHPHIGRVPLQLETHGVLLAEQLWLALASSAGGATGAAGGLQLPAEAFRVAVAVVSDFSQWLQSQDLNISAAALFARQDRNGNSMCGEEPAELVARRLLTVEMRDGLVEVLKDYRRHLEPDALPAALALWKDAHKATTRSELLVQATPHERSDEDGGTTPGGRGGEDDLLFLRRMGQRFIHSSVSSTAELAMAAFDDPPQVPGGRADWNRLGPRIKRHVEGLAAAVQSLLDELECEKKYYAEAWERAGFAADHLGITAAALTGAVRPRVELMLERGLWPAADSEVVEIPAGGGRLLSALETLDRLASRHPEPRRRPSDGRSQMRLVDILVPHVSAALAAGFRKLDQDITSHALSGNDSTVFQALRPPALLYCDAVVTLWRFIHNALDAPLSLGVPVDIVVRPFLEFVTAVLERTRSRLVRPSEAQAPFRLAARAEKVVVEVSKLECYSDSDDDEDLSSAAGAESRSDTRRKTGGNSRPKLLKFGSSKRKQEDEATKNVIVDIELLEVEPRSVSSPVKEVSVRINSAGFCLSELDGICKKLVSSINSCDDSDVPTFRGDDARRCMFEELPELLDFMREQCGSVLTRYLARRLVFFELRQELFERLYFVAGTSGGGGDTRSGATTPTANESSGGFFMSGTDAQASPTCLTLAMIIARRQDGLLALAAQTPPALMLSFVVELGVQLANTWMYVILDYLRRARLDRGAALYFDEDLEALKNLFEALMQEARQHISANTRPSGAGLGGAAAGRPSLIGLSMQDCDEGNKRLNDVLGVAQKLVWKVQSGLAEDLARFAGKVFGDHTEGAGDPERGDVQAGRGVSPSTARAVSPRGRHTAEASKRGGGFKPLSGLLGGSSAADSATPVAGSRGRSATPRRPSSSPAPETTRPEPPPQKAPPQQSRARDTRKSSTSPANAAPERSGSVEDRDAERGHRRKPTWKKAVSALSKPLRGSTPSSGRHKGKDKDKDG